jgi:Cellulose binding domain
VAARARAAAARVLGAADSAAPGGDGVPPGGGGAAAAEHRPGQPAEQGPAEQGAAEQGAAGRRPEKVRRPGRRRVSPALRRLVVTPTFAAGLGVVVAAFLAANMSRTVLHFSAPLPSNQCTAGGCHAKEPHGGTLASARPGVHITPKAPAASGPAAAPEPGSTGSAAGGSGGPQASADRQPPLSITYQQLDEWPGGFADQITISGLSGTRPHDWSLGFSYPGARIAGVQGARWEPGSRGTRVVARGVAWPGWGQEDSGTARVRLMVIVNGQPGPPAGCTFDGEPCTFASP